MNDNLPVDAPKANGYKVDTDSFHNAIATLVMAFKAQNPGITTCDVELGDGTKITIRIPKAKATRNPKAKVGSKNVDGGDADL